MICELWLCGTLDSPGPVSLSCDMFLEGPITDELCARWALNCWRVQLPCFRWIARDILDTLSVTWRSPFPPSFPSLLPPLNVHLSPDLCSQRPHKLSAPRLERTSEWSLSLFFSLKFAYKAEPYITSEYKTVHEELTKSMTTILKPSADFLTSNKLLKVTLGQPAWLFGVSADLQRIGMPVWHAWGPWG